MPLLASTLREGRLASKPNFNQFVWDYIQERAQLIIGCQVLKSYQMQVLKSYQMLMIPLEASALGADPFQG